MDWIRVVSLVWFVQCICVATSQGAIDVAEEVTVGSNVTGVEKDNDIKTCEWSVRGTRQFRISWSGNASEDSEVVVNLETLSDDCKYSSVVIREEFRKKFVDLPVCPNSEYVIAIQFDCSASEVNRTLWSPPEPPANVVIESVGNTSFAVSWSRPPGSGDIQLYSISVTDDGNFHLLQNSTDEKTSVSGLQPYTVYLLRVAAKNEDFWGDYSVGKQAKTKPGIPPAPENLRQTAVANTTIALEWDEPSVSTGPILKYRVFWQNTSDSFKKDSDSNDTSYTVTHLAPFVRYVFRVSAVTEAGTGNRSEELVLRTNVGVPHCPENLNVTSVTNTSVVLRWNEPAISTGPILKYRMHWRNSTEEGEENTLSGRLSHSLLGLAPYVDYAFKVLATTEAGNGPWSDERTVRTDVGIPGAPRNLKETSVTNTSVSLTWNEPLVLTGPILSYRIHWSNSSGTGSEVTNSTLYTVEHLTPFVLYTFRTSAETKAGYGPASEETNVRTDVGVPLPPTALKATRVGNTSVDVEWKEPTVSRGPILGYRVLWKNSSQIGKEDTPSNSSYRLARLTPYVHYTLRVWALTVAGPGERSEEITFRTQVGVPHAVERFATTKIGNTSIDVGWDAPRVSTGPILRYSLRWHNSSGSGEEETDRTRYKLERLSPYVYYNLTVLAITEAGPGKWSQELTVRTKIGVPHPPTHLTGHNVTNTSVVIMWSEPTPETGPILSYTVRWKSSRDSGSEDVEASARSCLVTGLLPYLNYTFTVSATTDAGRGEWSTGIRIETDIGVPSTPKGLHAEYVTNTSLCLKWNRPEFPNAPVLDYALTYRLLLRDDVNATTKGVRVSADKESVSYEIEDLLPYSYYSVLVSASSRAGRGPATDRVIAQTDVGVPLPAEILEVKAAKRRTTIVRWKTAGAYPGPVDYTLETWEFPGPCSGKDSAKVTKKLKGSQRAEEWRRQHETEVGDLTPFAVYYFKILLKTSATDVDIRSRVSDTIRIAPEAPSKPLELKAECRGSPTELNLTWKPPREPNGLVTSYRIHYGIERPNASRVVHVHNMCQSQSYVLKGLRPERRYHIYVLARVENVSEDGAPAHPERVCMLPPGIPFLGDTSHLQAAGSSAESLELKWSKETFSDYMGDIVHYAVLVGRRNTLGNSTSGKRASVAPPWYNFSAGDSDFYQATPLRWNPLRDSSDPLGCQISYEVRDGGGPNSTVLRCTIGLEKNCNETYCNGPLEPDTQYEMKIRAFSRGGYTETNPIDARSRPVPKPNVAGKVVAVIAVLFLLVALAGGGYFMKKKGHLDVLVVRIQSRLNPKEEPQPVREDIAMQMEECTSPRFVRARDFSEHVRIMMSDSHLKFSMEFEKLKNESPKLPCTIAEMEENRPKNRWMNIFPFDHSRVKLLPLCDEPGSDFINANYIPGYSSRREYIATQGPLLHVLDDFWRMVWEQSVNMIVMLTQCVERGKKKCEKYWPDSGETVYHGDLRITTVSVSMLSSYIIRIFHIQSGSYERLVKQMHFTHWPDFGCPESPADLINFVNAVREHLPRVAAGPILVHCSAGVGRTGTFIAVDRLMLQLRHAASPREDTVDVYGTVLDLRQHRTNMVQTEDQYIYIHLCVSQLIEDRERSPVTDSQDNIYSNLAMENDPVKPSAPQQPL